MGRLLDYPSNPGKSVLIGPDAASIVNAASLAVVPAFGSVPPVGRATLLEVKSDDESSEILSVTLDNPLPFLVPTADVAGAGTIVIARPSAIIEWGVGGVQARADVDFDHGLSLSVPGSFLRVTGVNNRIPATTNNMSGVGTPAFGRNVKLGAFCGYGSVAGTKNLSAKKTIYIDGPGLLSGSIPIPDYATNFTVQRSPNAGILSVTVLDEGGVSPIQTLTYPAGSGFEGAVELSGDAAFIVLTAPVGSNAIRVIFGLSF